MLTECKGFQWIGQPMSSCDRCGQPAWTHDFDERLARDASPFSDAWEYVPWPESVVGQWLADGRIDGKQASHLLAVRKDD